MLARPREFERGRGLRGHAQPRLCLGRPIRCRSRPQARSGPGAAHRGRRRSAPARCGSVAPSAHPPRRGCRSGFPYLCTSTPIWSMTGLSLPGIPRNCCLLAAAVDRATDLTSARVPGTPASSTAFGEGATESRSSALARRRRSPAPRPPDIQTDRSRAGLCSEKELQRSRGGRMGEGGTAQTDRSSGEFSPQVGQPHRGLPTAASGRCAHGPG